MGFSSGGLQEIVWVTVNRCRTIIARLAGLQAAFRGPFRLSGPEAPPQTLFPLGRQPEKPRRPRLGTPRAAALKDSTHTDS